MTRAFSGRDADELTLDRLARDELGPDDVRIHPETLEHQARVAGQHGNPQLAENFRPCARLLHQNQIMKTPLLLILSTLWRSPKKHFFTPLLLIAAWSFASTAQTATPYAVAA